MQASFGNNSNVCLQEKRDWVFLIMNGIISVVRYNVFNSDLLHVRQMLSFLIV